MGEDFIDIDSAEYRAMQKGLQEISMESARQFNDILEKRLKEALAGLGYKFSSEKKWIKFVKKRLIRVAFQERPHYYEIYLVKKKNSDYTKGKIKYVRS